MDIRTEHGGVKSRRRSTLPWSYGIPNLPTKAVGVYAFWYRRSGKCVYVGRASDQPIRDRLRQHWRWSHNVILRLWIQVYGSHLDICYAHVEQSKIETLERRLIRLWSPEANVQHKP